MDSRHWESSQEYIDLIKKWGFLEKDIPVYAATSTMSKDYLELFIRQVLVYPLVIAHKFKIESKALIEEESRVWVAYLFKRYASTGISYNDIIRFVDWALRCFCKNLGFALPFNTQVGTIPFQTINAQCHPLDSGEFCILIDPSCITAIESFSNAIFSSRIGNCTTASELSTETIKVGEKLSEIVNRYTRSELAPSIEFRGNIDQNHAFGECAVALTIHSLFFVLLHEYGHVANKHMAMLDNELSTLKSPAESDFIFYRIAEGNDINVLFKNTTQEYEADSWAVFYMHKIITSLDPNKNQNTSKIALCSPILFLGLIQIVEESYLLQKKISFDAHPPASERLTTTDMVLAILGEGWTNNEREFVGTFICSAVRKNLSEAQSKGSSIMTSTSSMWAIFDFVRTLKKDVLIPAFLMSALEQWKNPDYELIKKTIEESM